MANKVVRLVVIDAKNMLYSAYHGKKRVEKLKSDVHLDAEFIEYYRVHTDKVSESLNGPSEPESA